MKNSFPSVDIYDIVQEINILIIKYSSPIYSEFKGIVIDGVIDISLLSTDIGEILQWSNKVFYKFDHENNHYVKFNKKIRTIVYNKSMGEESTFITNFIGKKIFQVMKYSGLINCHSENVEGKQTFKLVACKLMSSSVDSDGELALGESLQVAEGVDTSYSIDNEEISINDIISVSENITEKEKSILSMYFEENKTLEEIGEVFSLTKERIRVIKENAINKLRKNSQRIKEMI